MSGLLYNACGNKSWHVRKETAVFTSCVNCPTHWVTRHNKRHIKTWNSSFQSATTRSNRKWILLRRFLLKLLWSTLLTSIGEVFPNMTFVLLFSNWPLLQCIEMQQYISQTLAVPRNSKSIYRPHSREAVTPEQFLWDNFKITSERAMCCWHCVNTVNLDLSPTRVSYKDIPCIVLTFETLINSCCFFGVSVQGKETSHYYFAKNIIVGFLWWFMSQSQYI